METPFPPFFASMFQGNWHEAQNDCFTKHDGSSLAKIFTQEQQDRVVASMEALETSFSYVWIGGIYVNGTWLHTFLVFLLLVLRIHQHSFCVHTLFSFL